MTRPCCGVLAMLRTSSLAVEQKGDDKMEHKDIWLVLGLTVILAVAVSLSTASITGYAPKKVDKLNLVLSDKCKYVPIDATMKGKQTWNTICYNSGTPEDNYGCNYVNNLYTETYYTDTKSCKKGFVYEDSWTIPSASCNDLANNYIGTGSADGCDDGSSYTKGDKYLSKRHSSKMIGVLCCK